MLDSFLDCVDDHKGQLVIIGDFFELLRYPLDGIISRRRSLLDRLARMETTYVLGNHDEDVARLVGSGACPHPFFDRIAQSFIRNIGGRRFKFMHGHEVDPLISPSVQNIGRMIGSVAYFLECHHDMFILSNDTVTSALLEVGEQLLTLAGCVKGSLCSAWCRCCEMMPAEKVTLLAREFRTHRMLGRYDADRTEGLYDIAIVGHTHKAGTFSDWYFNSGSWTGPTNDFLRIAPDGHVDVFNWGRQGPRPNNTVIVAYESRRFIQNPSARRRYG